MYTKTSSLTLDFMNIPDFPVPKYAKQTFIFSNHYIPNLHIYMHNISFAFKITFRHASISEAKLLHINVHKCALKSKW